jgi:hypothetical protein
MLDIINGKKTYIVAFLGAALTLAQAFGVVIPDGVLQVLGFLGLYTVRNAIANA